MAVDMYATIFSLILPFDQGRSSRPCSFCRAVWRSRMNTRRLLLRKLVVLVLLSCIVDTILIHPTVEGVRWGPTFF